MKRSAFYDGQRVFTDAMTYSQNSMIGSIQSRLTDLFDYGVVDGLSVGRSIANTGRAFVTGGVAYDPNGERITFSTTRDLLGYNNGDINTAAGTYFVVAQYAESNDGVVGVALDGTTVSEHISDSYNLAIKKSGSDSLATTDVRLANIVVTAPGASFVVDITPAARDTLTLREEVTSATNRVTIGDDIFNSTTGLLLFTNGTRKLTQDSNLFWDQTNARLGIKNGAPSATLDIGGYIRSDSGGFIFPDGTTQTTAATSGSGSDPLTIVRGITTNSLTTTTFRATSESVDTSTVVKGITTNALTSTFIRVGTGVPATLGVVLALDADGNTGLALDDTDDLSIIAGGTSVAEFSQAGVQIKNGNLALYFTQGSHGYSPSNCALTADINTPTYGIYWTNSGAGGGYALNGMGISIAGASISTYSSAGESIVGTLNVTGAIVTPANLSVGGSGTVAKGIVTNALTFSRAGVGITFGDGTTQVTASAAGSDPLTITKGVTTNALTTTILDAGYLTSEINANFHGVVQGDASFIWTGAVNLQNSLTATSISAQTLSTTSGVTTNALTVSGPSSFGGIADFTAAGIFESGAQINLTGSGAATALRGPNNGYGLNFPANRVSFQHNFIEVGGTTANGLCAGGLLFTAPGVTGSILTNVGNGIAAWASPTVTFPDGTTQSSTAKDRQFTFTIDGGSGSAISSGAKQAYVRVPHNTTITGWQVLTTPIGLTSFVALDVWKTPYASFPPTVSNSVVGSNYPAVLTGISAQNLAVTGWNPYWNRNDIIEVNVNAATNTSKVILNIIAEDR